MRDTGMSDRVLLGLDRVLLSPRAFPEVEGPDLGRRAPARGAVRGVRRVGLVTSDASLTGPGGRGQVTARSGLLDAGIPLTHLFTPEHGLSATVTDGEGVEDGWDPVTGLPVTSLYGPRLAPSIELLTEVDAVLFDLQDVGARFYTFLWTLSHVMESCARAGTPLRVLDRPNPLGGLRACVEGPLPDPDPLAGFLCRWPIPIRHSLTLGELALLLRSEMSLDLDLAVVPVKGWRRSSLWPSTGLPFVPPSPGIPTFPSALLYPGLALLEATNVSQGRGTQLSFQWFGAPWMDARVGAAALNDAGYQGVRAHPRELTLQDGACPGVQLEITDPGSVRPVSLGLRLLSLLRTLWPESFHWAPYPTATNPSGRDHLLHLTQCRELVRRLEGEPPGPDEPEVAALTRAPEWWERVTPHLLYP